MASAFSTNCIRPHSIVLAVIEQQFGRSEEFSLKNAVNSSINSMLEFAFFENTVFSAIHSHLT